MTNRQGHESGPCCTPGRGEALQSDASGSKPSHRCGRSVAGDVRRMARDQGRVREGMVYLEAGSFLMGTDDEDGFPADGEGPVREVELDPFFIDATPVTNAQFAEFVEATGYQTEAERFGWSFVFHLFLPPRIAKQSRQGAAGALWWRGVMDACWKWPEGRGSHIANRMDHPVVHVT